MMILEGTPEQIAATGHFDASFRKTTGLHSVFQDDCCICKFIKEAEYKGLDYKITPIILFQ
jgi:hypothetical protein